MQINSFLYPKGSEWRKWDLHVHTPFSYLNNQFGNDFDNYVKQLFKKALEKDIAAIGITDYFTIEGYKKLRKEYLNNNERMKELGFGDEEIKKIRRILILPNIEFRLNKLVGSSRINFHVVFSDEIKIEDIEENFLREIKFVYEGTPQDEDEKRSLTIQNLQALGKKLKAEHDEFKNKEDIEVGMMTAVVDDTEILGILSNKKSIFEGKYLTFVPADEDLSEIDWNSQGHNVRKVIIQKSDGFFSSNQGTREFGLGNRHPSKEKFLKEFKTLKPCIWGSDAKSYEKLFEPDLKRYIWIKADPTFEGLKQILYEPEPGDRVWIGPDVPDRKENYQIIKKIKFSNTNDFPEEIEFNQNLCSIIGGRSSGKSALLNYITHVIDPELVEEELGIKTAGEGEEYKWDKIKINHEIEWANGLSNKQSPGKVIYIPQNYLFDKSRKPEEIKRKIEPILFKEFPEFEKKYKKSTKEIDDYNKKISDLVKEWFRLSNSIINLQGKIRNLGDKRAIEKEKDDIKQRINEHRRKYSLSEDELKKYQKIESEIAELKSKIAQNQKDLENFQFILGKEGTFQDLKLEPEPSIESLPKELAGKINDELIKNKKNILQKINEIASEYKENLIEDTKNLKSKSERNSKDNKDLIDKYKKNEKLKKLFSKSIEYKEKLKSIETNENGIKTRETELENKEKKIKEFIDKRARILEELRNLLNSLDQKDMDIIFDIEYEIKKEDLEKVAQKVNLKGATDFVKNYELKIEIIRQKPALLLSNIYFGKQKINLGYQKEEVAIELLTLTETILFVGKMEGDRIGGFLETTMTPGRRALFLLKLILAESDDKWPLLIDQPEDNLDSRSIVKEIVPFLRKKKKERQIIMVSHNANFVIGADSEQIIVANRNGSNSPNEDSKQFNYLTGSIEYTKKKDESIKDTLKCQGVREHACLVLDGGKEAFEHRRNKYNLVNF